MKTVLVLLASLALSSPALAQPIGDADAGAMKKLAWQSLAEIEAGKMAADKAEDPKVKEFAQTMVDGHGKFLDELRRIAAAKGVQLPEKAGMREQAEMLKLRTVSGKDFDRRFMTQMVRNHEDAVRETGEIAEKAQDPELRRLVEQANANVKQHLQAAQGLAGAAASGGSR